MTTKIKPALITSEYSMRVGEKEDRGFDLTEWLESGETVASVAWEDQSEVSGLTLSGGGNTTTEVYIWLEALTANPDGMAYVVDGTWTTSAGRVKIGRLKISVRE